MKRETALLIMRWGCLGVLIFAVIYLITKSEIIAYIGIGSAICVYVANLFNCCPCCGKHMGREPFPTYCPHCGEPL